MDTVKKRENTNSAVRKSQMDYRKILTSLNIKLDTLQIKQCGHKWSEINFNQVTSISLTKQKKAFQNIRQYGEIRHQYNIDRKICAANFSSHIETAIQEGRELKGCRVSMVDFTKQALTLIKHHNQLEVDLLNSQWRDNGSLNGYFGNMIAMVDVGGSMEGDPLCAAIAIGIRIADKTKLGRRIMTFGSKPNWINLDGHDDFVSQVEVIRRAHGGVNTNFYAALDTILDAIIENKMAVDDVQDMVLVVLSDMQLTSCDLCDKQVLYESMKTKYEVAGIRVHGKPYKPPHILFWNLRSTSGFPSLSTQENCSMMSGFSPSLLNTFCDKSLISLRTSTPWSILVKSLENDRYQIMGDELMKDPMLSE